MKAVKRWRYYCDHCKKAGAHKGHMRDHEMRCFKNPQRTCPICERHQPEVRAEAIAYLKENYWSAEEKAVAHVEQMFDGCPACTMSAIMAVELTEDMEDLRGMPVSVRFRIPYDYKVKMDAYMAEKRRDFASEVGGEW